MYDSDTRDSDCRDIASRSGGRGVHHMSPDVMADPHSHFTRGLVTWLPIHNITIHVMVTGWPGRSITADSVV